MKQALLTAILLSFPLSSALAQNNLSEDNIAEIIVRAQKRDQDIKEVPIAVTPYSQDQLDRFGVQQFDDLADFVPGLEVQEQSANNPGFVIRGITSDSGDATIEPRVSIYQDGVSISRSRGSFVEVFDSSIEVVRGPQPTLFGRSALIGAINMRSNPADATDTFGQVQLGIGNLDYRFAEANLNQSLIQDQLAIRIAARYKERKGYTENILGEDLNGFETFAGRISVFAKPSDRLNINLIANIQRDDNPGTAFKSGTFLPSPEETIDASSPAALSTFGGFHDNQDLGLDREVNSLTLTLDYEINEYLSFSSTSNYRDFDSTEVYDPDGFALELFSFSEGAKSRQISQEFRLGFQLGEKLSGFVGGSYFDESGSQKVILGSNEIVTQGLLGGFLFTNAPGVAQQPAPVALLPAVNANPTSPLFGAPLGLYSEQATNFGDTESSDIFADATYALTDKLDLTAGFRHTSDNKTSRITATAPAPNNLTGVGLSLGTAILSGGVPIAQSGSFEGTTWRLATKYDLHENLSVFANYARGRRPEVIAYNLDPNDLSIFATGQLANNFELLPAENVDAFEIGIKGSFYDGKIYSDLSVYTYDYTNFQTSVINEIGQTQPINAGNASASGIETLVFAKPAPWAEIFAIYAYTDATFDHRDDSGNEQLFAGNRFRLTPEQALTLGVHFSYTSSFGTLVFSPIYSEKSELFFDNNNDLNDGIQDEKQGRYSVVDLRLSFTDPENRYRIEAFVENALDKDYLLDAGNVGDIFGIPTFIAAPPLTYGLMISTQF